jgi:phosphonate transport system permease protein
MLLRRLLPPDLSPAALTAWAVAAGGEPRCCCPWGSPLATWPEPLFEPARMLNVFSVDTLVYALLFVAAVGLGPGVLAVVAQLYSGHRGHRRRPRGRHYVGPPPQVRWRLPQVLPLFLSYVLYRLETNIRAATVLGFVGAGGIGFYLQTYLRMIDYSAASTVLLVTVAMVMIVDGLSSRLRARLV